MTSYQISGALMLRGIAAIYMIAFASLFIQVPALFGCDGLEPVDVYLDRMQTHLASSVSVEEGMSGALQRFLIVPTFLWFTRELSSARSEEWMDIACLLGMALSAAVACGAQWRLLLMLLYLLYLSMFHVGQTFLSFQWDILLLEAGLLAVLLVPFARPLSKEEKRKENGSSPNTVWTFAPPVVIGIQLLLFKLMLLSGLVKINNGGHWYKMTAMAYHYATTCLPTPLAFYFHQLPALAHEAEVALCLLSEIPATLLLLLPLPKAWRVVGVIVQLALQVLIQLTGNYTFFNLLTMILCLSFVDDEMWAAIGIGSWSQGQAPKSTARRCLSVVFHVGLMYIALTGMLSKTLLIDASGQSPGQLVAKLAAAIMPDQVTSWHDVLSLLHLKLAFGTALLQRFVNHCVPFLLLVIISVMLASIVTLLWKIWRGSSWRKPLHTVIAILHYVIIVGVVALLCVGNMPNYTRLASGPPSASDCESPLTSFACASLAIYETYHTQEWVTDINTWLRPWAAASSYGLFRSMTGVGSQGEVARPELIVEGFNGTHWLPYEFHYKPGDISRPPPWVAPHQPRLDWQMWFAALGSYQQNPWLLHWVYKLLVGSPTARDLIDMELSPFADELPQSIRIEKYFYDFALDDVSKAVDEKHRDWSQMEGIEVGEWWRRHHDSQWLPPVRPAMLQNFISSQGFPADPQLECQGGRLPPHLGTVIAAVRRNIPSVVVAVAALVVLNALTRLRRPHSQ